MPCSRSSSLLSKGATTRVTTRLALVFVFLGTLAACSETNLDGGVVNVQMPPDDFVRDPFEGKDLYYQYCGDCHGINGLGSDKGPSFVRNVYAPDHHADYAFYRAVAMGVKQHHAKFGDMPPVPGISPEQVAHITEFVRAVQRRAGIE